MALGKFIKPTRFVLVHGIWNGGWCWKRVARILRARGHRVTVPTQTGLGERDVTPPFLFSAAATRERTSCLTLSG
jgi:hypothetical protein